MNKGANQDDEEVWSRMTKDVEPLDKKGSKSYNKDFNYQSSRRSIIIDNDPSRKQEGGGQRNTIPLDSTLPYLTEGDVLGVDKQTAQRIKKGTYPIDGLIDLHGNNIDDANRIFQNFIHDSFKRGKRCILIITGKGDKKTGTGIIKKELSSWVNKPGIREKVLLYVQAKKKHGGKGATYILLKKATKG